MKMVCLLLSCYPMIWGSECEAIFTEKWAFKTWGGVSLSGTGSDLIQTAAIRTAIPSLLQKYHCKTMVDAPCGDYYWMKMVNHQLDKYIGIDIVLPLVLTNQINYGDHQHVFIHMDIINEIIPKADLVLCRDCLGHFSDEEIAKTIRNFKKSGSTYLLTTSFTQHHSNINSTIGTGSWRPLDLRQSPYFFPEPLEISNENCTEDNNDWSDKSLFLWKIQDLPNL